MDLDSAINYQRRLEEIFFPAINNLDNSEIAAITMGLYFSRSTNTGLKLENLIAEKRDDNIRKILERCLEYEESFDILNQHISYVEKILAEKK